MIVVRGEKQHIPTIIHLDMNEISATLFILLLLRLLTAVNITTYYHEVASKDLSLVLKNSYYIDEFLYFCSCCCS